jgi:hypothetical protein
MRGRGNCEYPDNANEFQINFCPVLQSDGFILFAMIIFNDLYFYAGGDSVTEGRIGGLGNEFHSRNGEPVAD